MMMLRRTFMVVQDCASFRTRSSLRPRITDKPSTNSNVKSISDAETMIKSKLFQPLLKKSLLSARSFRKHSNVKMLVNTLLPMLSACRMDSLMPWCSIARKPVFRTMQRVIISSNKGSLTTLTKLILMPSYDYQKSLFKFARFAKF